MTREQDWEAAAGDLLKAELEAKGLNYNDLSKRLTAAGLPISHGAVRLKLMRGRFSAAFLLQCLDAIGSTRLQD
jgi:hypothetical protein